jgi:saccharopine dehydrogenase-like NADP-dependent oxidoreductase/alanine dehydrogenase
MTAPDLQRGLHLWLRAETKPGEARTPLTPAGVRALVAAGARVTVEQSDLRAIPAADYAAAGAAIVPGGTWTSAPDDAVIVGIKELPTSTMPLVHRHVYFAHCFKEQAGAREVLQRFVDGGGTLFDLEYLKDARGRRVAAFGYWAGFTGAAVGVLAWARQQHDGALLPAVSPWSSQQALVDACKQALAGRAAPSSIVLGAKGRVGSGAVALLEAIGAPVTKWDLEETKGGGPFSAILDHDLFVNAVLLSGALPPFVTRDTIAGPRRLSMIADVSCDPHSPYNPIPVYDDITTMTAPTVRVVANPALDVMAIDHLPSLLPKESSEDFAEQLLPHLLDLAKDGGVSSSVWQGARQVFVEKTSSLSRSSVSTVSRSSSGVIMARVHWLGAGLSSGPGIRAVARSGVPLTLWNRTVDKAKAVLADVAPGADVRAYDLAALAAAVKPGDVVVSMLPAPMHPEVARVCLDAGCHLVTTSYISDAMRALHDEAKEKGLVLLNECGLDPGLDHMLAHRLVADYRASSSFAPTNRLSFRSYCGGFPKKPDAFRYKFSWSPLGVLRALRSPARATFGGVVKDVPRVWEAIETFTTCGEGFEAYPNRDSMPYVDEYAFDKAWPLDTFVRGTLRLGGWSAAWKDIFSKVGTLSDAELAKLADDLWKAHSYADGEPDRVVLYVGLRAVDGAGRVVFDDAWILDEAGNDERSAMGYLVSIPASFGVFDVVAGKAQAGVHGAPHDAATIDRWFDLMKRDGITLLREKKA